MARLGKRERALKSDCQILLARKQVALTNNGLGSSLGLRKNGLDKVLVATHRSSAYGVNGRLPYGKVMGEAKGLTYGISKQASREIEAWQERHKEWKARQK